PGSRHACRATRPLRADAAWPGTAARRGGTGSRCVIGHGPRFRTRTNPLPKQGTRQGILPGMTETMYVSVTRTTGRPDQSLQIATMAGEVMLPWLREIDGFDGLLML